MKDLVLKEIKIFISSPGDVIRERNITRVVVKKLETQFARYFKLTPVLWEYEDLESSKHFNKQLIKPSECDIVVCIFWSRFGSKPSQEFRRSDGSFYNSGTEWEFEDAKNANVPIFTYFKNVEIPIQDNESSEEKGKREEQIRLLQNFRSSHFGDAENFYTNACHDFLSEQDFELKLEEHLKKRLIKYLPQNIYEPEIKLEWTKGSPFKGLSSFEIEDEMIFKGRDIAIKEVVDKLQNNTKNYKTSLLFILGMSGCGKSSLVKGGVIPYITKPGAIAEVGFWNKIIFKPSQGVNGLFSAFSYAAYGEEYLSEIFKNQNIDKDKLATLFQSLDNESLDNFMQNILLESVKLVKEKKPYFTRIPEPGLVIYTDQFEELFSLESIDNNERELFVSFLISLAKCKRIKVIASLRSDYYHKLTELTAIKNIELNEFIYNLQVPTFVELSQIIRYPAMLAGLKFGKNPQTNENLDSILLEIASKSPESLPLLEFTLEELYKNRNESDNGLTYESYQKLGGMEGALAKKADEVLSNLDDKSRDELFNVFRKLVSIDGVSDSEHYKFVAKTEFYDDIATSTERKNLLDAFIEARLLVVDEINGKKAIRVAHEALFKKWEKLSETLQDYIGFFILRQKLENRCSEWESNNRHNDYLLTGRKLLEDANSFEKNYKSEIDDAQLLEFIRLSIRADINIKTVIISVLVVVIVCLSFLTVWALHAEKKAVKSENTMRIALTEEKTAKIEAENEKNRAESALIDLKEQKEIAEKERDSANQAKQEALRNLKEAQFQTANMEKSLFVAIGTISQIIAESHSSTNLEKIFDAQIRVDPKNDYIYAIKGFTYGLLNNKPLSSIDDFNIALELNPKNNLAILGLGYANLQNGNYNDALYYADKLLNVEGFKFDAYLLKANIYMFPLVYNFKPGKDYQVASRSNVIKAKDCFDKAALQLKINNRSFSVCVSGKLIEYALKNLEKNLQHN